MNIALFNPTPDIVAVGKMMTFEGDTVVQVGESDLQRCSSSFDLVLTSTPSTPSTNRTFDTSGTVIGGDFHYTRTILTKLGFPCGDESSDPMFSAFVTRYFDGEKLLTQRGLGIPLVGLCNNDLGPKVPGGCGMRYVGEDVFEDLWTHDLVLNALQEMSFKGFVSISFEVDETYFWLVEVTPHVPSYGLFCLLEGVPVPLSSFFSNPVPTNESWVVALLVSRFPYPLPLSKGRTHISGFRNSTLPHLWSPTVVRRREAMWCDANLVGVVTSWDRKLYEASGLSLDRAAELEFPDKMYRTDAQTTIARRWGHLKSLGIVSPEPVSPEPTSSLFPETTTDPVQSPQ